MIEFMLRKTALRLDFSFFAVMFIFFFLDSGGGLVAVSACIVHELSHLVVMAVCKVPVESITFYGAGIRISAQLCREKRCVRVCVLGAGVAANLLLSTLFYALGEYAFSAVNLITGAFNLLPIGEFDGAQLLRELVYCFAPVEKADRITFSFEVISLVICSAAIFLWGRELSVTFFLTVVYLLILMCRRL